MKIRVLCSEEEFKKFDLLQEIFNNTFKELSMKGFNGSLTVETESIVKKELT